MKFKVFLVVLTTLILTGGLVLAPKKALAAGTVGFIDVQRVFTEYKETKKAKDKLAKEEASFKTEFNKREKEIQQARDNKKLKESEVNDLIAKKSAELEPMKEKLSQLNQDLIGKIQKDIIAATDNVAKKLGIDLVVDKQVIIIGGIDLTDKVIYQLNQGK